MNSWKKPKGDNIESINPSFHGAIPTGAHVIYQPSDMSVELTVFKSNGCILLAYIILLFVGLQLAIIDPRQCYQGPIQTLENALSKNIVRQSFGRPEFSGLVQILGLDGDHDMVCTGILEINNETFCQDPKPIMSGSASCWATVNGNPTLPAMVGSLADAAYFEASGSWYVGTAKPFPMEIGACESSGISLYLYQRKLPSRPISSGRVKASCNLIQSNICTQSDYDLIRTYPSSFVNLSDSANIMIANLQSAASDDARRINAYGASVEASIQSYKAWVADFDAKYGDILACMDSKIVCGIDIAVGKYDGLTPPPLWLPPAPISVDEPVRNELQAASISLPSCVKDPPRFISKCEPFLGVDDITQYYNARDTLVAVRRIQSVMAVMVLVLTLFPWTADVYDFKLRIKQGALRIIVENRWLIAIILGVLITTTAGFANFGSVSVYGRALLARASIMSGVCFSDSTYSACMDRCIADQQMFSSKYGGFCQLSFKGMFGSKSAGQCSFGLSRAACATTCASTVDPVPISVVIAGLLPYNIWTYFVMVLYKFLLIGEPRLAILRFSTVVDRSSSRQMVGAITAVIRKKTIAISAIGLAGAIRSLLINSDLEYISRIGAAGAVDILLTAVILSRVRSVSKLD